MTNQIKLTAKPVWGWETAYCHNNDQDYDYKFGNKIKILGYLPLTGTALAILKTAALIVAIFRGEMKGQCMRSAAYFIRFGIEFTGFALLTLPLVDLLVTVHRGCTKKPKQLT